MPHAKKGSPEAKAKMAKARAARLTPQPSQAASEDTLEALKRRIDELEKQKFPFSEAPQVTARGVIGVLEKYIVDPKHYPDPRTKLWEYMNSSPELRRHGFTEDSYEMTWDIKTTNYDTIDGRHMKEPKFTLEVWGIIYDDVTGKPSKKYRIHRLVFHEDPQAAIAIANEKGLTVDENLAKDFLDEMRFMRIRDWLMDLFIPPKLHEKKQSNREEVIGNKLVDVIEISSAEATAIPFSELKSQL